MIKRFLIKMLYFQMYTAPPPLHGNDEVQVKVKPVEEKEKAEEKVPEV